MTREEELKAQEQRLRMMEKPAQTTMEERAADPKFDAVREALDRYHDHDETFNAMLDELHKSDGPTGNQLAQDWFAEQDRLKLVVGYEFVKVTPNSVDKAPLVGIEFPERCSGYIRSERKGK
jgi:hypothetical protein